MHAGLTIYDHIIFIFTHMSHTVLPLKKYHS